MGIYVFIALFAYICGSIPFGYLLVKLFLKTDVRETGSGNIGATNVARTGAKGLAILTLLLDAVKGAVPVLVAGLFLVKLARSSSIDANFLAPSAALFAILGHLYPVWLKFRGGKGVATALGAFVAYSPTAVGIALGVFALTVLVSHYVSLGSILSAATYPIAFYLANRNSSPPTGVYALLTLCSLLIIWKHRSNIQRLLAGTEHRFPSGKPTEGKV